MRPTGTVLHRDAVLLAVLGQRIRIECCDPELRALLVAMYESMAVPDDGRPADLCYRIDSSGTPAVISISRPGLGTFNAHAPDEMVFLLEADVTVVLQRQRPDLLFMHAAAIEMQGKAFLLAAASGGGKSTTAWALLHHGFGYLSDELSPVDLDSLCVYPYPRALSLKHAPPSAYPLPDDAIRLPHTIHVGASSLRGAVLNEPRPIGAVFVLQRERSGGFPTLRTLEAAEAAAYLYVNALNALAHSNRGLEAVVHVAGHVPCYAVSIGELRATCALIEHAVKRAFAF